MRCFNPLPLIFVSNQSRQHFGGRDRSSRTAMLAA